MTTGKKTKKINYRSLFLGIALNILVIIVFILLYHAYFVAPKLDANTVPVMSSRTEPSLTPTP